MCNQKKILHYMSHDDSGSVLLTRPWLKVLHRVEIYDVTTTKNDVVHHVN
jgi:hypothetical protein